VFRVTADPHRFDEAVAWFRARLPITDDEFAKISTDARQRAWTVSGVSQIDVVNSVWLALDKANEKGTPFAVFKKQVIDDLAQEWGRRDSARVETVFRNATQSSLNRGRYAQMKAPDVVKFRPFWMYDAVRDGRTTQLCTGLDDTVLPQDHEFWDTHIPPLHHRCRAGIRNLRRAEAERRGILRDPPDIDAEPGFGRAPGKGEWEPDKKKYPKPIQRASKKRQARNPKPAGALQDGKHFKKLSVQGLTAAEQTKVLEAARKAKLVDFLEKRPLSELFFAPSLGHGVNGAYWPSLERLGVRVQRGGSTVGNAFDPGKSWSISYSGKDRIDAIRRTFVHELGHHVHITAGTAADVVVQKAFFDGKSKPITEYGGTNRKDYFAESFAAYVFHRGALRKHDPVGYRMVREVLALQGIPL
jgi:hypothetical protein